MKKKLRITIIFFIVIIVVYFYDNFDKIMSSDFGLLYNNLTSTEIGKVIIFWLLPTIGAVLIGLVAKYIYDTNRLNKLLIIEMSENIDRLKKVQKDLSLRVIPQVNSNNETIGIQVSDKIVTSIYDKIHTEGLFYNIIYPKKKRADLSKAIYNSKDIIDQIDDCIDSYVETRQKYFSQQAKYKSEIVEKINIESENCIVKNYLIEVASKVIDYNIDKFQKIIESQKQYTLWNRLKLFIGYSAYDKSD